MRLSQGYGRPGVGLHHRQDAFAAIGGVPPVECKEGVRPLDDVLGALTPIVDNRISSAGIPEQLESCQGGVGVVNGAMLVFSAFCTDAELS